MAAVPGVVDSHGVMMKMWEMQNAKTLCDVYLKGKEPDAAEIPAHRAILAARSPVFNAMFCSGMEESRQKHVSLPTIPRVALELLVQYIYTSEVCIDEDNVVSLLEAAIFIVLEPLAETCWSFVERHADLDDCVLVYYLAARYDRGKLAKKAKIQTLRQFQTIAQSEKFLQLEKYMVMGLIESENINVENEDAVLDAVFTWIRYAPAQRTAMLTELLSMVRLAHVKPDHLQRSVAEFIGQIGSCGIGLSELIQQSIQAALSVGTPPRESCEFSQVFLNFHGTMSCIDPRSGIVTTLGDLPDGLRAFGLAVLDRFVFVLGTVNQDLVFYSYDLDLGTWISLAAPEEAHLWGSMVALAGRIYAVGGTNKRSAVMSVVECFDPVANMWQRVARLPEALSNFGFIVHEGILFTFGGLAPLGKKMFRYDPQGDVWTKCTDMPVSRYGCSACLGDYDMIYVLGGVSSKRGELVKSFDAYDPRTDQWLCKGELPTPGRRLVMGAVDSCVYVLGAYNWQTFDRTTYQSAEGMQAYDETMNTWSARAASLYAPFSSSTCAVVKFKKDILRKHQGDDVKGKADSEEESGGSFEDTI